MADRDTKNTHVEREKVTKTGGSNAPIAFIVGGLVVAALVLFWLFSGGDTMDAPEGAAGDVDVNVESTEQPAADSGAIEPAAEPADAGAETDAGAGTDTGDAGAETDAGTGTDTGDAGTDADAGAVVDTTTGDTTAN